RVQVAVRVEPDDAEPVGTRGETLDCADVRAAASTEHERPFGKIRGDRERLSHERVLLDDGRLRIVERQARRLDHLLAAVAPRAWDAHEPGCERPAAGMALVPAADGHRRVRA